MTALVDERVEALLARARRDVDEGRLPACQLAVGLDGEIVVSEAFGDATTASRFHIYSAVKPTVSIAVLQLVGRGEIGLDTPVAALIEEFGTNGMDAITVGQVLLHAGGFPHAPMPPAVWNDPAGRREVYARWRLNWEPGTAYEYHASSAHWVLADIIGVVTGRHHADVVTDEVLAPAGVPRILAIDPDDHDDILDVVGVGEAPDPTELARAWGVDSLPVTEVTDSALLAFNDPAARAAGHPAGGGIATAADLARWYQALLHDDTIVPTALRADVFEIIRQDHPDWLGVEAHRTYAFVLAGDDGKATLRGHGHGSSPGAFGHGGAKGQKAWADPATGLSFAYLTNGLERDDLVHARRGVALSSLAAVLTRPPGDEPH